MKDGTIIPGVRHYSPDMRALMQRIYGRGIKVCGVWLKHPYYHYEDEQGFIDTKGAFLTRREAFVLARESGQCPHLPPEGTACLFSEDLY